MVLDLSVPSSGGKLNGSGSYEPLCDQIFSRMMDQLWFVAVSSGEWHY